MDLKERPEEGFSRHPWELARYDFFRRVIRGQAVGDGPVRVLDVGAGDAWFSSRLVPSLPEGSQGVCWDIGYGETTPPAAFADARLSATTTRPNERFDLVLLLDVAEHVLDDRAFVQDITSHCLSDQGLLVFSVPAWAALTTAHDQALGHHRRYSPKQGRELLRASGLRILRSGGLFHSLTLPRGASALLEKFRGRPENPVAESLEWKAGPALGGLVNAALSLDGLVSLAASHLEFEVPGLSWWAVCSKNSTRRPSAEGLL